MNYADVINQFSNQTIAVIGDVMLDRYIYGAVDRISPEAPIPIIERQNTHIVPGGAGNAAANVTALGAICHLLGLRGDDHTGRELVETLQKVGISTDGIIVDDRPTTEKIRVVGNHQQIARIDHETKAPASSSTTKKLINALIKIISQCDAIIVCDYAKGVVTKELMDSIRELTHKHDIPLLLDPRPEHADWYHGLTYITPNRKEASGMIHQPIHSLEDAQTHGLALAKKLNTNLLLTMSEAGMMIVDHQANTTEHLATKAQEVTDVSGAGDTVIAAFALALATETNALTAATIANHAASVVVAKSGTATVTQQELLATFS